VAYCNWLAEVTGKAYRLPSEAEWEKGARGAAGRIYPWGNEWDPNRCNSSEGGPGDTTPVGGYPQGASPYGLLDMAGNVWEWCHSLYKPYPYDAKDGREDPKATAPRVVRGGAFGDLERNIRCACRDGYLPYHQPVYQGLRLVVAPL
jgi:formylglycine-generating enzyme required for sulfatase activity